MRLRSQETTGTAVASGMSDRQPMEASAVCDDALLCEQLWNERGRSAAVGFASGQVSLLELRETLRVGTPLARTKALYIMSLLAPSVVLEDFTNVLRLDECPVVRHEAAYYLGTMQSTEAVHVLGESMLNDPQELVRHEAAEALGELGLASGLGWLKQAANDDSELVRRTVDIAVKHIALKTRL